MIPEATPLQYTYESPAVNLTITVIGAEIDEKRAAWNRGEATLTLPKVRIRSVAPVKVYGKLYEIDVEAGDSRHGGAGYVDTSGYQRGYRNVATGAALVWDSKSHERISDMVKTALAWLETHHAIEWRAESTRMGWQYKIDRQAYEISRAQETIAECEREIARLAAQRDAAAAKPAPGARRRRAS